MKKDLIIEQEDYMNKYKRDIAKSIIETITISGFEIIEMRYEYCGDEREFRFTIKEINE